MAVKKPAKKTLTQAELDVITSCSANQTVGQSVPKTYDPAFPVFDIPVNKKLLVYIPNHTIMQDGIEKLRMDKFNAHAIRSGRSFGNVRCTQGIEVPSLGLDGTCPLCDGVSECWDLYNAKYAERAKMKAIDKDSAEAKEGLRADRQELMGEFAVRQAECWYTFPMVVIECEEKDGVATTKPKVVDGKLVGHPYFYSIRENTYQDKWVAAFDGIDTEDGDEATHPAGRFAILNFTCNPKNGEPTKMESAKSLIVTFKDYPALSEWRTYFDTMTEAWTPAKAQEVVVLDAVRDMEETLEECNNALKKTREELQFIKASKAGVANVNALPSGDADAVLGGAIEVKELGDADLDIPAVGEMGV